MQLSLFLQQHLASQRFAADELDEPARDLQHLLDFFGNIEVEEIRVEDMKRYVDNVARTFPGSKHRKCEAASFALWAFVSDDLWPPPVRREQNAPKWLCKRL